MPPEDAMPPTRGRGAPALRLVSHVIGPLPLLNAVLRRLQLEDFLHKFVPAGDRRQKLSPAVGLGVLLRNILLARRPLYGLAAWAQRFDPGLLGLPAQATAGFNDDRVGRCLDALFLADRASLMTELVVRAVREFGLDLRELHNDSTTVTFTGQYAHADGTAVRGRPTHRITRGVNKDHRTDLKQLLFVLTTTADGAVPIWAHVDHGNTTDDVTHIRTWETLRQVSGTAAFLYVADCKLCTTANLAHIALHGGRFVTVIPATWREHAQFHAWLRTHEAPWEELLRKPNARRATAPEDIYRGYEHPQRTTQGFRVVWIFSSQKEAFDRRAREMRLEAAEQALHEISVRIGQPHSRLLTYEQVSEAVQKILRTHQVQAWIQPEITVTEQPRFVQATRGRPGPTTTYVCHKDYRPALRWQCQGPALLEAARTDGIFPLITNDEHLSMQEMLIAYKHQPALEKRHEQFKSVLQVRPMMLKNHMRIEAFLFLYFLALLAEALIERDLRQRMRELKIKHVPLYPEERPCAAPTTERLFELFEDLRHHRLVDPDGQVRQDFYDELSAPQRLMLRLLKCSPQQYWSTAEQTLPDR
jgi:transposase